jgi:hypothetical protein
MRESAHRTAAGGPAATPWRSGGGHSRAYHPRVPWAILAVALVAFMLALVPTRRLSLAGWRPAPLATYLGVLVALAVAAVFLRAGIRVVVPLLLVLYILPFVGAPEVVARTVTRIGGGRPPRVVDGRATPVPGPAEGADDGAAAAPADGGAETTGPDGPSERP